MKPLNYLWPLVFCIFSLPCWADSLSSRVDRTEVGADETLSLVVRFEGDRSSGEPDFSGLNQHFEILSNSQSMQRNFINGRSSSFTEWTLLLFPKTTGQLLIPPFSFQGQSSKPITITVKDAASDPTQQQDVFIEAELDKNEVFVQEQIILVYKLFFNRRIDAFEKPDLVLENTRIEELPRVDYQRNLGGETFGVAEFRFALFPDASGVITVPKGLWSIRTTEAPGGRFGLSSGRFKLHRLKTPELTITVKPKPDTYPNGAIWLPAKKLEISERWSRAPSEFKVGEPITRTITLNAQGLSSEQLPPIYEADSSTPDFKFYPDQPQMDNKTDNQGIVGTRSESLAVVPTKAGELKLPAVEISWWNTESQTVEVASLPAKTVYVQGGQQQSTASPVISSPQLTPAAGEPEVIEVFKTPWYWPVATALLLLCSLCMTALWWQAQGRTGGASPAPNNPSGGPALSKQKALLKVKKACKSGSASEVRKALVEWAQLHWPEQKFASLQQIRDAADSESLRSELNKLDSELYGEAKGQIDYALIEKHIENLKTDIHKQNSSLPQKLYG